MENSNKKKIKKTGASISFYIDIICLKELSQDLGMKKDPVVIHVKEVKRLE